MTDDPSGESSDQERKISDTNTTTMTCQDETEHREKEEMPPWRMWLTIFR